MLRAYKYRLYPTKNQRIKIDQTIGVCRKDPDVTLWEVRCDEFLKNIGAVEFEPLKMLICQLEKQLKNVTTVTS